MPSQPHIDPHRLPFHFDVHCRPASELCGACDHRGARGHVALPRLRRRRGPSPQEDQTRTQGQEGQRGRQSPPLIFLATSSSPFMPPQYLLTNRSRLMPWPICMDPFLPCPCHSRLRPPHQTIPLLCPAFFSCRASTRAAGSTGACWRCVGLGLAVGERGGSNRASSSALAPARRLTASATFCTSTSTSFAEAKHGTLEQTLNAGAGSFSRKSLFPLGTRDWPLRPRPLEQTRPEHSHLLMGVCA